MGVSWTLTPGRSRRLLVLRSYFGFCALCFIYFLTKLFELSNLLQLYNIIDDLPA